MNIFFKYKKILLVLVFLIIAIGLGYLLYFFFFRQNIPLNSISSPEITGGSGAGLPTAVTGTGQIYDQNTGVGLISEEPTPIAEQPSPIAHGGLTEITQLNNTKTLSPTLDANGVDLKYYDKNDEKFYRIDKNGNALPLSDQIFHNVEKITWSPKKNKAILEYPDGANTIYNFDLKKQITLPKHWENFNFSPDGNNFIMKSIGLDPNNRWLAISNGDGSMVQALEPLGNRGDTVYPSWSPNNQIVAMYTEGVDFNRQKVYFVGLNDENFKSMTIEGRGFESKWSTKGDRLLYSVYSSDNDYKPSIWVVNAVGDNIGSGRKNLKINTWADKCVYSDNNNIYCAVPENLDKGAGLFPEMAQYTKDRLYKINTSSGLKKLVAVPNETYNMSNLIISDNGYYLYFTDKNSELLHKIKLK